MAATLGGTQWPQIHALPHALRVRKRIVTPGEFPKRDYSKKIQFKPMETIVMVFITVLNDV